MIKILAKKRSQTLDAYYPEKVHDLGIALEIMTQDILRAVMNEMTDHQKGFYRLKKYNIECEWQSDKQGSFTYNWIEATVTTETDNILS